VVTTFGPTHVKSSASMDGSRRPRSEAIMALARPKSASASLEIGGGPEGGRGWTGLESSGLAKGLGMVGMLSKNDIFRPPLV